MKYTHKGVEITLADDGTFKATIAGKPVTTPSLAAMKSRLDKTDKVTFEPFDAIRIEEPYYRDTELPKLVEFKVVGLVVRGRKTTYHEQTLGFKDNDDTVYSQVVPATPENRAIMKELLALKVQRKKTEKQFDKDEQALEKKLAHKLPERD